MNRPAIPAPPRPRSIAVGFAGKQGQEYLPLVRRHTELVGLVDTVPGADRLARRIGAPFFPTVEDALARLDFDVAVVTVPHSAHFAVCELMLHHGKHVIKEKPFAINERDAVQLRKLALDRDRSVYTLVQRNFVPSFEFARRNLHRIGTPYWFSYEYHLDLPTITTGWRADRARALGGVMLDMGYHMADVVNRYFGLPAAVQGLFVHRYEEMRLSRLEDLASVHLYYPGRVTAGALTVSRHYHEKLERLTVLGAKGSLRVEPQAAQLRTHTGGQADDLTWRATKQDVTEEMFACYVRRLDDRGYRRAHLARQLSTVRLIDGIYHSGAARLPGGAAPAVTVASWNEPSRRGDALQHATEGKGP
uniref:AtaP10 protein n=1 Tax=Saccharothrix mutabilis subsp. capreolus TaxID=66854 RepID=Q8RJX1_STRMP|nr:AtaP10 protein [Saccharothrix mutabilis subsp. capreolus]